MIAILKITGLNARLLPVVLEGGTVVQRQEISPRTLAYPHVPAADFADATEGWCILHQATLQQDVPRTGGFGNPKLISGKVPCRLESTAPSGCTPAVA